MGGSSKKVTVGYKYYLGMHMVLCHGPIDQVKKIQVDRRDAWVGATTGGRININKPGLFGGEDREGGVVGAVDVEMGKTTQLPNDYLQSQLGNDIPAFRGVVSAILRQVYLGVNPYLKAWAFRAQRVYLTNEGQDQWYSERAGISHLNTDSQYFFETFANGLAGYQEWQHPTSDLGGIEQYDIQGGALLIKGADGVGTIHPSIYKELGFPAALQRVKLDTKLVTRGPNDNGLIVLRDKDFNSVVGFNLSRDSGTDPNQLARFSFVDQSGTLGYSVGSTPVEIDKWYSVLMEYNSATGSFYVEMRERDTDILFGSNTVTVANRPDINSVHFENDGGNGNPSGSSLWDNVEVIVGDIQVDMNPAHIIRECLTDFNWGMGYLPADVDDASFQKAADTLYEEGMGISLVWDRQMPIDDFINEIIRHIDATLFVDRVTGKFTLKLIRDDYVVDDLITLGPSNIQKVSDYGKIDAGNSLNSVTVTYWDSNTGENGTVTADDISLIQAYGSVINTSVQYPGFTSQELASRAAARDLRALSNPLLSATIEADRNAAGLNIGDAFKFEWPRNHEGFIVMRVNQISFGDGKKNRVKIIASEDVFSLPSTAVTAPEESGWQEPGGPPLPPPVQIVNESPYFELVQELGQSQLDSLMAETPEIGYLQVAATRPDNGINAQVWVNSGAGYEDGGPLDFAPHGKLATAIDKVDTSMSLSDFEDLEQVVVGTHGQVGEELFVVDSIDPVAGTLTIGRAILDTVPSSHSVGDDVVFWDAYSSTNGVEYVDGETLNIKVLTNSSQGQLDLAAGVEKSITMDQRALRPFRPANLQMNGDPNPPESLYPSYPVSISWASRNRLQETAGNFITWYEPAVTPEAGTTYQVTLESLDENLVSQGVISTTNINQSPFTINAEDIVDPWIQNPFIKASVASIRDGITSLYKGDIIFRGPFREPTGVQAIYRALKAPSAVQITTIG